MAQESVEGFSRLPGENPQDTEAAKEAPESSRPRARMPFLLCLFMAVALLLYVNRDFRITIVPKPLPESPDRWAISLLSSPEVKRLMRYHGVNGLCITDQMAFIKRDGLWICVFHDPPTDQELKIVRRIVAPLLERTATLEKKPSPPE